MKVELKALTDDVLVAAQITPDDLPAIAAAGVTTLICNRPDDESLDQPEFARIESAAQAEGINVVNLPVVSGRYAVEVVAEFRRVIDNADGKVLAYCRSGTRSTHLWALSQSGARLPEEIIACAAGAGYDISGLRPYLG